MVSGIVLWSAGASLTGVGAAQIVTNALCRPPQPLPPRPAGAGAGEQLGVATQAVCSPSLSTTGVAMVIAGQLASVIAIPLFVVGNGRVPLGRGMAALRPELRVGAGSAALRFSF
jgi:hypothetical protein